MIQRAAMPVDDVMVLISARDAVLRDGVAAQLSAHGLAVVDGEPEEGTVVALAVADEVDEPTLREIRSLRQRGIKRVVLVVNRLDDGGVLAAAGAGVVGVVRRTDA